MKLVAILFLIIMLSGNELNAQPFNTLTPQEKEKGWILLLNGHTTDGWRIFRSRQVSSEWKVENGTLHKTKLLGGNLITADQYENFILELEWKIEKGGNSGVLYQVQEDSLYFQPYFTGLEMQILDDKNHADARNGLMHRAGALYDIAPVTDTTAARPAGEWNKTRIVVNRNHTEHWLNGKKVVGCAIAGDLWEERVAESKFKSWPDFGKYAKGHIALQDHFSEIWFRNIKLKKLAESNQMTLPVVQRTSDFDSVTAVNYTGTYVLPPNPIAKQLHIFQKAGKLYVQTNFVGTPYTDYLLPLADKQEFLDTYIGFKYIFKPDNTGNIKKLSYQLERNTVIPATNIPATKSP